MSTTRNAIDAHNLEQRRYFGRALKKTMVPTGTPYLRRHVEELASSVDLSPGERLLEVGCGMGRYTLLLAQRYDVTGIDLTPELLERLRGYAGGLDLSLYCADIVDPPDELIGAFDVVCGFFTLHHLHDIPRCMASMYRLLTPGGRLAFVEPNAWNPLYYAQIAATPGMTWKGDKGVARMRPGVVLPAMQDAGFSDVGLSRFGFFPPFIANRPRAARLERALERLPIFRPVLPFQLFSGRRPPQGRSE